jgi:hypothetical protein
VACWQASSFGSGSVQASLANRNAVDPMVGSELQQCSHRRFGATRRGGEKPRGRNTISRWHGGSEGQAPVVWLGVDGPSGAPTEGTSRRRRDEDDGWSAHGGIVVTRCRRSVGGVFKRRRQHGIREETGGPSDGDIGRAEHAPRNPPGMAGELHAHRDGVFKSPSRAWKSLERPTGDGQGDGESGEGQRLATMRSERKIFWSNPETSTPDLHDLCCDPQG